MSKTFARVVAPLLALALLGATGSAHAQDDEGSDLPVVPLVVSGAGVVIVGLGGLFALRASTAHDDAVNETDFGTASQRADDARSLTSTANLLLLAGGAVLAVGLGWTAVELTDPDDDGGGGSALVIGPGSLAVRGDFH